MLRRSLFVLGLMLAAFAIPASAGQVFVGSLMGKQYEYPFFAAFVQAEGDVMLTDAQFFVTRSDQTLPVVPDKVEKIVIHPEGTYVVWKIFKYATDVVRPGDQLTAVVGDIQNDTGEKTVPCGPGSTKKKSRETAVCQ